MARPDIVDDKLHEIERTAALLVRKGALSEDDCRARITGIHRCVRIWRREGHPAAWIINLLCAAEDDLLKEFSGATRGPR